MQIIPAILATTEDEYRDQLEKIRTCPELVYAERTCTERSRSSRSKGWVQIDFMDNKFVQNKSIEPNIVTKNPPKMKIEAHMMVQNPMYWLGSLLLLKPQRVIVPVEIGENAMRFISDSKGKFPQIGLSLSPETDVQIVEPFIIQVNSILVMSVHPGFQAQGFLVEVLEKVVYLRKRYPNNNLIVGVDGGITADNVKLVADVGADYAVVGSHLLQGDISKNLERFKQALNG